MEQKYLLFAGIIFLVTGILLRALNTLEYVGLSLIIFGVICKSIYIITKIRNDEYNPGPELIALGLGLVLLSIGLYCLDSENLFLKPIYFISLGISLKMIFVVRFIQIIRSSKKK